MEIIPDTTFVTMGFNEAVVGLINYDTMVYYSHATSQADTLFSRYISGTRVVAAMMWATSRMEFIAFDKINPNKCQTFQTTYGINCASCNLSDFMLQGNCVTSCPLTSYFTNTVSKVCESCVNNCKHCNPASTCQGCINGWNLRDQACV